jgi:DNA-binding CsgD family transcriptional regulator
MARSDVLLVPASTAACSEGIAALLAGRAGVVLTVEDAAMLPAARAAAAAGFAVVSSRVVEGAASMPLLTAAERDLLRLVAGGASNREAAEALGVSTGRVKRAITRLARELDVDGRAGLVALGRSLGV